MCNKSKEIATKLTWMIAVGDDNGGEAGKDVFSAKCCTKSISKVQRYSK
jgi:hypothetical protein